MTTTNGVPRSEHRPHPRQRSRPEPSLVPSPAPELLSGRLLDGRPLRSRWRMLAAIGTAGEAVAHIPVIQMHLSEAPYIGVGFVFLTVAGLLLTQLLISADTAAVWICTLVVSVLALAGYLLSRTVGLPQIGDDVGNWGEPLGILALVTETVMLLTSAAALTCSGAAQPNTGKRYTALLGTCAVLLAGCGSAGAMAAHAPATRSAMAMTPGMIMPDGSTMRALAPTTTGATVPAGTADKPSAAAQMICAAETRTQITKVLALTTEPISQSNWANHVYTCTYQLPMGLLVLSVTESADPASAQTYTDQLRAKTVGATSLSGLTATAFGTPGGLVVLLKDNDTLRVDATALPAQFGSQNQRRADFAYEIASDILGCWTGTS